MEESLTANKIDQECAWNYLVYKRLILHNLKIKHVICTEPIYSFNKTL